MSGVFGVVSKGNCAQQLFYGTDYHSHLGTEYGGMALYDEGFTIGGARQRLEGEGNKGDINQSQQIIRQTLVELEELLSLLKR